MLKPPRIAVSSRDRRRSRCVRTAPFIVLMTLFASTLNAQVPADPQVAIFYRVLSYDRSLATRAGGDVVVAVVYRAGSETAKGAIAKSFKTYVAKKLQGLPMTIVEHEFKDAKSFASWMASARVDVAYLTPGLEAEAKTIQAAATKGKVAILAASRATVEQGAPIGVIMKDNKPAILINLTAARSVGMDLDPKVLQLAEVIR